MKRITKAALGGVAGCALILGATLTASGAAPNILFGPATVKVTDLRPAEPTGPLDGAFATLRILESPDEGTGFRLRVTSIDPSSEGHDFGAHLHIGPCATLDSTLGHYGAPGLPFPENEVWFDLVPDEAGVANDETWVPFVVPADKMSSGMSIVIHRESAALPVSQSPKEVCLPVVVESP